MKLKFIIVLVLPLLLSGCAEVLSFAAGFGAGYFTGQYTAKPEKTGKLAQKTPQAAMGQIDPQMVNHGYRHHYQHGAHHPYAYYYNANSPYQQQYNSSLMRHHNYKQQYYDYQRALKMQHIPAPYGLKREPTPATKEAYKNTVKEDISKAATEEANKIDRYSADARANAIAALRNKPYNMFKPNSEPPITVPLLPPAQPIQ